MSIVAYRNGVMASDSQITEGSTVLGSTKKVFKRCARRPAAPGEPVNPVSRVLVGVAGNYDKSRLFRDWIEKHDMRDDKRPDMKAIGEEENFEAILVYEGDLKTVVAYENACIPLQIEAEFYAIGSGRDLALGAMTGCAQPGYAVDVAINRDIYCGGDVHVVSFDDE